METLQSGLVVSRRCSELVRDLIKPNSSIYLTDFLASFSIGLLSFLVFQSSLDSLVSIIAGGLAGLALYRCSVFIHEIQHHSDKDLGIFPQIWNSMFGIPFLMPIFLYGEHSTHHSMLTYGTQKDPEYPRLKSKRMLHFTALMALGFVYPLLGPLRFAVITPFAIICPDIDRFVYTRLSSLYNIKIGYKRPLDASAKSASRWFQEITCCLWAWTWIGLGLVGLVDTGFFLKTYIVFALWMLINQLRTLAAHRYNSGGLVGDHLSQLLDTNTFDRGWATTAWAPVGLRYHALHHLLPKLPYHNLELAHNRIIKSLPVDSPYHKTIKRGLRSAIRQNFVEKEGKTTRETSQDR
jgi:fatty acid desaturase